MIACLSIIVDSVVLRHNVLLCIVMDLGDIHVCDPTNERAIIHLALDSMPM